MANSKLLQASWALSILTVTAWPGLARSESWEARLRRELPIAWAEMEKRDRAIDNRTPITIESTLVTNAISTVPQKIRYARMSDRVLLETSQVGVKPFQAFCLVGKEGFALERQMEHGTYAVRFVGTDTKSAVSGRISKNFPEWRLRFFMNQGRIKDRYDKFFSNPLNHISAVEPVQRDGTTLVRVRAVGSAPPGADANSMEEGVTEMLLDPAHHWLILGTTTQRPNKRDTSKTFEYGNDEDGHPTLKRFQSSQKFIDGNGNLAEGWEKWEFTKFSFKPLPDSAFTMAALRMLSFDSPSAVTPATMRNYWLLGLALAFAVVAVVTRIWRSRRPLAPTNSLRTQG